MRREQRRVQRQQRATRRRRVHPAAEEAAWPSVLQAEAVAARLSSWSVQAPLGPLQQRRARPCQQQRRARARAVAVQPPAGRTFEEGEGRSSQEQRRGDSKGLRMGPLRHTPHDTAVSAHAPLRPSDPPTQREQWGRGGGGGGGTGHARSKSDSSLFILDHTRPPKRMRSLAFRRRAEARHTEGHTTVGPSEIREINEITLCSKYSVGIHSIRPSSTRLLSSVPAVQDYDLRTIHEFALLNVISMRSVSWCA